MRKKHFVAPLTDEDVLDVHIETDKATVTKFALNYRAKIDGLLRQIYRVDNYHGFLHEQRFWRGKDPIPIKIFEDIPLTIVINAYIDRIKEEYEKYKQYYVEKNKKENDK